MIELKFCKGFDWNDIEIIELNSFEEFFYFYLEHNEEGLIYGVKLKGDDYNERLDR